jgi:hypothetical protein
LFNFLPSHLIIPRRDLSVPLVLGDCEQALGGLINVIVCILAAAAFYGTRHTVLFSISIAAGLIALWSWGVMHNFATASAKRRRQIILERMRYAGRPEEECAALDSRVINPNAADMDSIPNWLTLVNMLTTLVGIVLFFWGVIPRLLSLLANR